MVRAVALASGGEVVVTRDPAAVRDAAYVVVPGQGAFGPFVRAIAGGLEDALREHLARERPYLGICLGMQVLFASSDEAPGAAGLGVLDGHVQRLAAGIDPLTSRPHALPHIGWNSVEGPLAGERAPYFYFAHTYAVAPDDPGVVAGTTRYGEASFTSAVASGAIRGVQFHPEKSQREGLALLTSFFRL